MDRRKFITNSIYLTGSFLFFACGSAGGGAQTAMPTPASGGDCSNNGTNIDIGANHGHTLVVSAADVNALADKTYDISGVSGHFHSVTITAAQFATLQGNTGVQVTSTNNGHEHIINVSCA